MNFHRELRKSSCRRLRKNWIGSRLRILDVRAHVLIAARAPGWEECRIRYYPAVGRIYIHGPAGQYIGWADNLANAIDQLARTDTRQVLPENGLLNERRPIK